MNDIRTIQWYRTRSLWLDEALKDAELRPSLHGDSDADVVIVGGGLIGMWAAYQLSVEAPQLSIVVIDREIAGYGAAGRNGGWAGAGLPGSAGLYAKKHGWSAVREAAAQMRNAVDDIGRVAAAERIDCGYVKGGTLSVATTKPQAARLRDEIQQAQRRGLAGSGDRLLTAEESRGHVRTARSFAGSYTPDCARIDPALLVRGLADAAERRGVTIHEHTEATEITEHTVRTPHGNIRASHVVVATEAWTSQLRGHRLSHLPLTSMMIATEPLPDETWDELGWRQGLTVRDKSHLFFYAQRTRDNRIAIGGRGSPYNLRHPRAEFSSRDEPVWRRLEHSIAHTFPAAASTRISHRWGGILGVPRDWSMGIRTDARTGAIYASGLSGHGVVAANVAGRTIADLILGTDSALARMPWVGHRSRSWEPEPARYVAASAIVRVLASADDVENRTGRTAHRTRLVKPFMPPV